MEYVYPRHQTKQRFVASMCVCVCMYVCMCVWVWKEKSKKCTNTEVWVQEKAAVFVSLLCFCVCERKLFLCRIIPTWKEPNQMVDMVFLNFLKEGKKKVCVWLLCVYVCVCVCVYVCVCERERERKRGRERNTEHVYVCGFFLKTWWYVCVCVTQRESALLAIICLCGWNFAKLFAFCCIMC